MFEPEHFEVTYENSILKISEHTVVEQTVFRVQFPDGKKPLILTRSQTASGKIWMSIPQGRQKEAEEIGRLIVVYYKSK